jgi:hypothetical protein
VRVFWKFKRRFPKFQTPIIDLNGLTILETTQRYFRVNRRKIAFLRFIFEGYDGIAIIKTVDPQKGIILFQISPGCEDDVEFILQDLKKNMPIESINI